MFSSCCCQHEAAEASEHLSEAFPAAVLLGDLSPTRGAAKEQPETCGDARLEQEAREAPARPLLGRCQGGSGGACRYSCVVERPSGMPWGLQLDPIHPYLLVTAVLPSGAVDSYNAQSKVSISQDDLIIRINGCTTPQQMLSVFLNEGNRQLVLSCSRPRKLDVCIQRAAGQPWGITVEHQDKFNGLVVKRILDHSVASRHNAASEHGQRLLPTDLILAINDINGAHGGPPRMKLEMKEAAELRLVVLRISEPHA